MLGDVECADTRENGDDRHDELEEAGEDETLLSLLDALGCKTLLDDVLVESPVSQVSQPHCSEYGHEAGHVGVSCRVM